MFTLPVTNNGKQLDFSDIGNVIKNSAWDSICYDVLVNLVVRTGASFIQGRRNSDSKIFDNYQENVLKPSVISSIPAFTGYVIRKMTNKVYGINTAESYEAGFVGGCFKYGLSKALLGGSEYSYPYQCVIGGVNNFLYERNKQDVGNAAMSNETANIFGQVFAMETVVEQWMFKQQFKGEVNAFAAVSVPFTITAAIVYQDTWAEYLQHMLQLQHIFQGVKSVSTNLVDDISAIVNTSNDVLFGNTTANESHVEL